MLFEAATLAVVSFVHLSGLDGGTSANFRMGAGIAEGVLCVVLLVGAIALQRGSTRAAMVALGVTILGFLYGLSITLRSGHLTDIVYHATMLPILALTLVTLFRARVRGRAGS